MEQRVAHAKAGLRRRAGFTLAEVAVASVIVALLAAVTVPSIANYLDHQRAVTTANALASVSTGIGNSFKAIGKYPGKVSELDSNLIVASDLTHNSCGSGVAADRFVAADTTTWRNNEPFVTFWTSKAGYVTPIGTILDSMVRSPASATPGTLAILIPGTDTTDAYMLDRTVDNGDGGGAGTVRFNITSSSTDTVRYLVPVGAKC